MSAIARRYLGSRIAKNPRMHELAEQEVALLLRSDPRCRYLLLYSVFNVFARTKARKYEPSKNEPAADGLTIKSCVRIQGRSGRAVAGSVMSFNVLIVDYSVSIASHRSFPPTHLSLRLVHSQAGSRCLSSLLVGSCQCLVSRQPVLLGHPTLSLVQLLLSKESCLFCTLLLSSLANVNTSPLLST